MLKKQFLDNNKIYFFLTVDDVWLEHFLFKQSHLFAKNISTLDFSLPRGLPMFWYSRWREKIMPIMSNRIFIEICWWWLSNFMKKIEKIAGRPEKICFSFVSVQSLNITVLMFFGIVLLKKRLTKMMSNYFLWKSCFIIFMKSIW